MAKNIGYYVPFFAVGVLLMFGCDREFAPVQGTVTFKGEPLATGTVTFYPVAGSTLGYARIVDGNYAAKTGTKEGLRPGEYRVTVTAYEATPIDNTLAEKAPGVMTPLRYRRPETSGLHYEVRNSGNTFDIALESK